MGLGAVLGLCNAASVCLCMDSRVSSLVRGDQESSLIRRGVFGGDMELVLGLLSSSCTVPNVCLDAKRTLRASSSPPWLDLSHDLDDSDSRSSAKGPSCVPICGSLTKAVIGLTLISL